VINPDAPEKTNESEKIYFKNSHNITSIIGLDLMRGLTQRSKNSKMGEKEKIFVNGVLRKCCQI
jgi:hypothetical protein